jgi:hypothetical protein
MNLPIIDLDLFLSQPKQSSAVLQECKNVSQSVSLHILSGQ